jgi:hypothetical protein
MIRARMAAIFQPRGRGALGMQPFDQVPVHSLSVLAR